MSIRARRATGVCWGARLELLAETEEPVRREALLGESLEAWQNAGARNPHQYFTATQTADVLQALGRNEEALAEVRRALELAPLYEETRLALALHYHRLARFEQAEKAYLWAARGGAANPPGEDGMLDWLSAYRQLLDDASGGWAWGSPGGKSLAGIDAPLQGAGSQRPAPVLLAIAAKRGFRKRKSHSGAFDKPNQIVQKNWFLSFTKFYLETITEMFFMIAN
jgi:tetratricopeptide (TPR) repeat protein